MPRFVLPVLILVISTVGAAVASGVSVGVFGPFGLLMPPILLAMAVDAARRIRRRRASIVLGYLNQAVRMNLPLATLVHAAADTEVGPMRRRLRDLADRLGYGDPVADALRDTVDDVDARSLHLIGVGEWSGRLGPTLAYLARRLGRPDLTQGPRLGWVYVVFMLGMVMFATVGISIRVLPMFNAVAGDFGISTPPVTQSFRQVMNSPLVYEFARLLAIVLLATFVVGTIAMVERVVFGRIPWGAPLRGLRETLGVIVPPLGAIEHDRGMADLCFVLGEALGAGLSATTAVNEASQLEMPGGLRRRVVAWSAAMERGEPIADAARSAGLPRLVVALIGGARTSGDMAAVFAFLNRHYEYRVARALAVLRAAVVPLIVIAMGAMVAWVALAMLMPTKVILDAVILQTGLG